MLKSQTIYFFIETSTQISYQKYLELICYVDTSGNRMILLPTHDFCLQITPRAIPIKHFYLLQALTDKFVFA